MKKVEFVVMEHLYESKRSGQKATGVTVMVTGELKEVLDKIMKERPEYKDYSQAVGAALQEGLEAFRS